MVALADRLRGQTKDAVARFDRVFANPDSVGWIGAACVAVTLFVYLRHSPRIFDIRFADETIYLGESLSHNPALMGSYENSGLYSLFYRFFSLFIGDPVNLYLWGGAIIIAVCGLAIFVSIWILSRSPIFAMLSSSIFIFGGALNLWPRISYAAISVIAAGLSCAHFVRPWLAKSGILLLTGFLVTFIRPEYIIVFYAFLGITIMLVAGELVTALRAEKLRVLGRLELAPGWIAIAVLLLHVVLWSFPVWRDNGRAFLAFSQHFSLRYVETNGLSFNPWWNQAQIIGSVFPGAKSEADAFRIAPQIFVGFLADNTVDGLKQLLRFLSNAFRAGTSVIRSWLGLLLIIAGCAVAARIAWAQSRRSIPSADENRQILADAGAGAVFMTPVLISSVAIYPREHYVVILLYLLFMSVACLVRWRIHSAPSATATLCVGMGLALAAPSLPRVPQPQVQSIAALRAVPDIKVMFEADLGWCVYYQPSCRRVWPRVRRQESFSRMIEQGQADAIMLSHGLIAIAGVEDDPLYRQLRANPRQHGYEPVTLPNGNVLLLKR